ncbi:MAG: phosphatidylserine decarboxylase family protein [Dysgonamonadaceae bacterium]|jgi:phosphatidylserine decarboxylase|nr:phosphatidylserine decarboxylase family protein [Dysgonamonadaceae bacterium]
MTIHKEGYKTIAVTTVGLLLLNLIIYYLVGKSLFFYFILFTSTVFFLIILNFFRRPVRIFEVVDNNVIVAPADGTVVVIEEVKESDFFQEDRLQLSIFMNVFNVHINWIPIGGKILHSSHQRGRFMAAYLPKSSVDNERSSIIIESESGQKILVRQIAGALAKRIVTYTKEGQNCRINQQLGFIKFGSRVDLYLPLGTEVLVKPDDKVYGNRTAIARLK